MPAIRSAGLVPQDVLQEHGRVIDAPQSVRPDRQQPRGQRLMHRTVTPGSQQLSRRGS